ncbi:MAG: gamma-glutamylcyclotransferase family protein [Gammaproteobacteria bacterium]
MLYYFSYGSNMSTRRLRARTPSARKVNNASLSQHQLLFHHASEIDGSAKCNALYTGNPVHVVHGVLFAIDKHEKPVLDKCESLGIGYEEKFVSVETVDGTIIEALTYTSLRVKEDLKPFSWYKQHVLRGAIEHGLPEEYLVSIDTVESIFDSNQTRHEQELAVYDSSTTGSTSSGH